MTELRTVRVAALPATPVVLDAEATVDKACGLLAEAAAEGRIRVAAASAGLVDRRGAL